MKIKVCRKYVTYYTLTIYQFLWNCQQIYCMSWKSELAGYIPDALRQILRNFFYLFRKPAQCQNGTVFIFNLFSARQYVKYLLYCIQKVFIIYITDEIKCWHVAALPYWAWTVSWVPEIWTPCGGYSRSSRHAEH